MQITYDKDADAMYLYLSEKDSAKTVRVSNSVIVDLDANDNLRGVEILFASKMFADNLMRQTTRAHGGF